MDLLEQLNALAGDLAEKLGKISTNAELEAAR